MIAAREELASLPASVHGGRRARHDGGIDVQYDFSVCLNAFGTPPGVRNAIAEARIDEYPDPSSAAARRAAATAWSVGTDEITFGAGAAELIHAVCLAYIRVGDPVVIETPAFGEYARAAMLCGAQIHPCAAGVDALCDAVAAVRPRLAFVCSPTSPGGIAQTSDGLACVARACRAVDSLLVIDQAYDAFAEHPMGTPALRSRPSVLHLRSLTKEFAIAGVRVAFAVGDAAVIGSLDAARVPWSASTIAEAAAIACFTPEALTFAADAIKILRSEARRLTDAWAARGYAVSPSTTHYFTVDVGNAAKACTAFLRAGILVRDCTSFDLPAHIRIAARTRSENDALLAALNLFLPTPGA